MADVDDGGIQDDSDDQGRHVECDDDFQVLPDEDYNDDDNDGEDTENELYDTLQVVCNASSSSDSYSPFPSKQHALLYLLLHCPRPIYYSSDGTPFYANSMMATIRHCFANQLFASVVQRYPVQPDMELMEMYHGERWRTDPKLQTPMAVLPGSELHIQAHILLTLDQLKMAFTSVVYLYPEPGALVILESSDFKVTNILTIVSPPSSLLRYMLDSNTLEQLGMKEFEDFIQPHPLKYSGLGKPVVTAPIILYSDDTSGNKSKKWNCFNSWCFLVAGLPRSENSQLRNIHFITCSNKVSVLDMSRPVAEDIKTLQEGITVFDAFLKTEVIVRAPVVCLIADNPRAAEVINHRGGSSRKYCRKCMVDREVDPVDVSTLHTKDVSLSQMRTIQSAQTESEKESLRTSFGLRERENPMLSLNVDLYQSTPVECLHAILLGPVKYLLKRFIAGLKKEQKAKVLAIVQQFNYSGFDVRLYGNIIKHHCSFVGRDYKAWAQMAAFIVTPYVTTNERKLWLALLKVFSLAYCVPFNPNCSEESRQVCIGVCRPGEGIQPTNV
ncbi:uncharacterized protein LOC135345042 isoform X2 [Halichondria panicea]|uniref:uncharacterized protein LOC135345042 isoform X2 n=1 Tax=Halichondria panicea TaxID=6063 RepID=UPI00312B52CC